MTIIFEDENGCIIHETKDNVFIPSKDDLILLNSMFYNVRHRYIDYDKKIITIDLEIE